jgi:hypothetical protein
MLNGVGRNNGFLRVHQPARGSVEEDHKGGFKDESDIDDPPPYRKTLTLSAFGQTMAAARLRAASGSFNRRRWGTAEKQPLAA